MKSTPILPAISTKMKILHLEDQVSDADLVAHILKKANIDFEMKLVSTRQEYTEALEEFKPELIISDHNLPAFNSMEAMEVLRKARLKIPFVLVTGTVSEEFAVEAMRAGADDYILKDRLQRLPVAIQGVLEKYRLEQEKKKSDTLLRNIDANSLDMICSVSEAGYFLHVSAASETILGYTPAELIGKRPFDFVYQEDMQKTIDSANYVMAGKLLTNFQNRYVRKDGSLVTLSWSTRWDEHDRVRYGVARDVTEKNIADEKIRQAETLLRNIDANSLDVICTVNHEGIFTYVSSASVKVWGYTPAELLGQNFMDFVYEEDKERTSGVNQQIASGLSIPLFENRYVRKDGSVVPMIWSSQWDENEKMIYCVVKDATEIKKLEHAHRSEQQRFIDLFLEAPAAIGIVKGPAHVYQLFNPLYQQFTGRKDIIGKTAAEVFPELESQGLIRLLDKVYHTGKTISRKEVLLKMYLDNSETLSDVYCDYVVQPYRNAQGEVEGVFFFSVDVTEQVLSKRHIEASEKRYRQIVETAQEGIWVIDEHDTTTFVNSKMCEILEYSREEMIGREFSFFMDEEGKELGAEFMQKKKSGQTCQDKIKYTSKTGKEIWTHVSANPLFKEDGVYGGALSMVTDITRQKKIEEENKKLTDVASLTVNAVIVTDVEGRITWVNKGFERLSEYTFEEVVGKKPGEMLKGPNTDETVSKLMGKSAKSGQGFRVEILNYSKSGRQYWLDIEARPLHDSRNRLTGFMAIEQDITERKKYQDFLVRRDNQLTLAAQIARLGYWEYDVLTDIFTFNDQFYDVFRTTAEAVGGYTMTSARYAELFVHPDDAEVIAQSVREAIEAVDPDFSFKAEHRIVYPTGEIGFIYVHFRTIKDELGRTIKNFGVNQDITERKTVELERLALIDGLQNKNKDLQQFSYIVSHNLRAPIAKIMGLVSVMESESEENKFLLEKLTEEAEHLDDVVKDINTIVSARKSAKEKMEPASFETEIKLIKQVLEDKIADSKATILTDFSAAPEIWSIKSYLHSILYNLILNSIKYRRPGVPPRIEVKSTQDEKFICLSVGDNGEGIDLVKNGGKVFGLYKRFHTGSVTGKGIGLNLVKTHVESLGGRVEIESELNVGSTFRVYLPKI
jgi:PAS domain S-box-containing protein